MRLKRWLRWTGIAVLIAVAALAAFVQVQQHLLRWRAERLLADIRDIQMGKSTWSDAQVLMHKWGAWGAYEGNCTAEFCDYQIVLQDSFRRFPIFFMPTGDSRTPRREWCESFYRPYRWLGGRSAFVAARFVVRNGIIWGKDFSLDLGVLPDENHQGASYVLMGSASTVSHFSTLSNSIERVLASPEYLVGMPGGCEGCAAVYVRFTPFADPKRVDAALADFQLDCLTRRRPCVEQGEVMPETWRELHTDQGVVVDHNAIESCQFPLELLGRDNRDVAIAEVVSNRWTKEIGGSQQWTKFLLKSELKGSSFEHSDETDYSPVNERLIYGSAKDRMQSLQPGMKLILAFDNRFQFREGRSLDIPLCGIIPLTDENLASVERGIQRDVLPADNVRWPY